MEREWQPEGFDKEIMRGCWAAFVAWVMKQDDARKIFKEETGIDLEKFSQASPIEKMIDEATGRDGEIMKIWCEWVTQKYWGTELKAIRTEPEVGE